MSLSEDNLDVNIESNIEETAREISVESQHVLDRENVKDFNLTNTDGDSCNSYEWSVIFILVFVVSIKILLWHSATLFKRRASLSCFDVFVLMLFASTIVQFGPMMSQALHSGHGVVNFSQSGCKLQFFTDYGMRHVITFLVLCFFSYAYLILFHRFEPDNLDGKMRGNVGWFILLLVGIEGLFGMVPAIYVDVAPTLTHCVWTTTMRLTTEQVISMELALRPLLPYLIPLVVLIYPLFRATEAVNVMAESKVKSTLFTTLVLTWSYLLLNTPYAVMLLVEGYAHLNLDFDLLSSTFCNFKWLFFLLHQSWFLLAASAILALEWEKGTPPVGSTQIAKGVNAVRGKLPF